MPTPRVWFTGCGVVNDVFYVLGGQTRDDVVSNVNYAYYPIGYNSQSSSATTSTFNNNNFPVQSNSTVTGLAFDNKKRELTFNVTGVSGTTGYASIVIPKSFLSNANNVKVYLEGTQIDCQISSDETSWILTFNYSHSTHQVKIDFGASEFKFLGVTVGGLIIALILVTLALAVLVTAFYRRNKINRARTA
jgi:hypothetical protein